MEDLFKIKQVKEKIINKLELPEEIVFNYPKIIITSNTKVEIENHKGVMLYSSKEIKINTNIGVIKILGSSLELDSLIREEIVATGEISEILFLS